jgi:hypothetical protein
MAADNLQFGIKPWPYICQSGAKTIEITVERLIDRAYYGPRGGQSPLLLQERHHQDESLAHPHLPPRLQQEGRLLHSATAQLLRSRERQLLCNLLVLAAGFSLLVALHSNLPLDCRVPVVFYRVVRPPGQHLRNHRPLVAKSISTLGYSRWASMMVLSSSSVHFSFTI